MSSPFRYMMAVVILTSHQINIYISSDLRKRELSQMQNHYKLEGGAIRQRESFAVWSEDRIPAAPRFSTVKFSLELLSLKNTIERAVS